MDRDRSQLQALARARALSKLGGMMMKIRLKDAWEKILD